MAAKQPSQTRPGIHLERDEKGRVARRSINLGNGSETRSYAYDSAGRLIRVADGAGALCEAYQYDHKGRRLSEINPARFTGERRSSYAAGDRLSQAGSAQYRHDAAGFRSLKDEAGRETRYQYEPSGLLLAVDLPSGRRIGYGYDALGQRVEKRVDGRLVRAYRWLDPLRLLEFFDGREWWRLVYDPKRAWRAPVAVTNGQESYFIFCDQLGTPLALANLDGHIVQAIRYDSFGNLLQAPGEAERRALRLPLGFAGGLYDSDTGLTRYVWRDYDADTGRFTALDPLGAKGGDADWYGYCVDDPVNRIDVWGLWSLFGVEFGGEGRPFWQPQYGNWGGKDWSGGQNPNRNSGEDGSAPSTDSADDIYKTHDTEWRKCDNADIIAENPKKWRKECRSAADHELVDGLGKLPKDPKQWIMPPATGTETEADLFRKGAQWLFK